MLSFDSESTSNKTWDVYKRSAVKQAVEWNIEGNRRFCGQRKYEHVDRRMRHSNLG